MVVKTVAKYYHRNLHCDIHHFYRLVACSAKPCLCTVLHITLFCHDYAVSSYLPEKSENLPSWVGDNWWKMRLLLTHQAWAYIFAMHYLWSCHEELNRKSLSWSIFQHPHCAVLKLTCIRVHRLSHHWNTRRQCLLHQLHLQDKFIFHNVTSLFLY